MSKESGDGPVDEKLRKAIADVEAKDFKVLTKEEYEKLIKLQVVGEKPPSPSMSTPDATGTQKKPNVSSKVYCAWHFSYP